MFQTKEFRNSNLEFVSDFDIRISDFIIKNMDEENPVGIV